MKNHHYLKKELYELIRNDERIFDFIQESSLDGLWYRDLENSDEEWVNPKFWTVLGYDPEVMPHKASAWKDIINQDDLLTAIENFTKHCEDPSHPYDQTVRYTHKNGSTVWIRCRGLVIRDGNGKPVRMLGGHQDITNHTYSENLLKHTAFLLNAAQRIANMGAWELDLGTGKTLWTDEIYNIHEVEKDFDHNKANGIEFYHPDHRPIISKAITDTIEMQIPFDVKCKFITAKGNLRWVRSSGYPEIENGKVVRIIGVFRDITQEEADKEAIQREQMFSKQLLENMADGFSVIDLDGRQIGANKAFCEMTRFSEAELLGQTAPFPYWPEEELESIDKAFQQTLKGAKNRFELIFKKKNGERFPILISTSILKDESGNTINYFANIKDITEQKNREAEIVAINQEIQNISRAVDAGSIVSMTNHKGIIVKVNQRFCELSGYSEAELLGQNHRIINSGHHDKSFWREMWKTITSGKIWTGEIKNRAKDGSEYWVYSVINPILNQEGVITHYMSIRQDITERKLAEIELEATKQQLESIFSEMSDVVWSMSYPALETLFVTPSVEALYGYPLEQWVKEGSTLWQEVIHLDDRILFTTIFKKLEEERVTLTYRIITIDGKTKWVKSSIHLIKDASGCPIRIDGQVTDITEEKLAHEALERQKRIMTKAEELAELGSWEWDITKDTWFMSKNWKKIHGFIGDTITTEQLLPIAHSEDRPEIQKALNRVVENGEPYEINHRIIRQDTGEIRHVAAKGVVICDTQGKPVRMLGAVQDITERKLTADILEESELRFSVAIEGTEAGIWDWDMVKNQVTFSKQWKVMLGYEEDEVENSFDGWKNLWHPEDASSIEKAVNDHLHGLTQRYEIVHRCLHKNGEWHWIMTRGKILRDSEGNPYRWIGTNIDITKEKEALIELQKTKDFLLHTSRVARVGGWDFNNLTGEIFWTKMVYEIYEVSHDFVPTYEHMANFYTPESWVNLEKAIQEAMVNGTQYDLELQITTAKGKMRWVRAIGNSEFKDDLCIRLFGIIQDITDQKKADLILEESEKKFRELFENLIDEVHLWKLKKDENEKVIGWELVDANPSALKAWGKSIDQVIGKTANEIFETDAYTQFLPVVEKIFSTGEPHSWEEYFPPTNQYLFMESIPFGDHFISTGKDITAQKKIEQKLKDSELRLSLALQAGKIGVWDWDIENNILTWDEQMFSLYGVKREDFSNAYETWVKGVYEADRDRGNVEIELAIKGEKEFNTEFRVQHPTGEIRSIRAIASVVRDADGKAIRMIGTNWDITNEKETLEQLKKAKEQADSASRAKSEFLANMSHEIRTPLNGVIGFSDLLKNTPLNAIQQEYANNASVSGQTLLNIINDILDFSKIEAGMLELESIKSDMIEIIENCVDIVKYTSSKKNLELLLAVDPNLPRFAEVDPIRIKQVLTNLLSNAVKFTEKGEVELKVGYTALDDSKGKLSFAVRDTGIGISDAQKERLFKAFSQADSSTTRNFGGTGLGLIISEMIAHKMGSKINIDSIPGVGSTFYFDITTTVETGEKFDTTQIANVKRCLIIDDNPNNCLILKQILNQWQIDCDSCESGQEAMELLATSQQYDAIICDYSMSPIDGLETIRMIRDRLNFNVDKIPMILLHSSSEDAELHRKCDEMGVHFRLSKPVKSNDLFSYLCNLQQPKKDIPNPIESEVGKPISQIQEPNVSRIDNLKQKIKILVVEDTPLNMFLIKAILAELVRDAEIVEAEDGAQALEQHKTFAPDLILLDVQMPVLDGIEATKKIREIEAITGKHVPIIALTAGALKEEKERCFDAGMDNFLTKPVRLENVKAVLDYYLP